MSSPISSHVKCEELGQDNICDVPVNKLTSFNGKLNQFLHSSDPTSTSTKKPSSPSKRGARTDESENTLVERKTSPKRTKTASSTAIILQHRSPSTSPTKPPRRKRRPASPFHAPCASTSLLRDTIPPNLILLLVGVNPGLLTGTTGHAYAHPSNLFWKLLHTSGITSIRHPPSDTYRLPALYSVGNTNIVERPTRDASMLSKSEMDAGVPVLEAKVAAQRPEAVCLVGKSIWEAVWRVRHGRAIRKEEFSYGWQGPAENMGCTADWAGAPVFVATTTSGLAASMTLAEKEAVWGELGGWVVQRRKERVLEI
ncbi:hypothetical protein N7492_006788 [Penicillium capsulatum]|uniref:Uracil-DNA glycosylase-like domain-containing protein n=1 Tax=Penicillium capsulatum TaxID=69766 RepID=A0A9W9I0U0_9EURO|nr:hypothetical protein N7492_006788 [Penicillium capsulatum]KAJ6116624.1 hypothetical protein N7512_006349 [Penicillium capsulatum]